jgi:hypothetical protein
MAVRRRSEKHAVSIVETLSKRRKTEESSIAGDHVQAIMIFTVSIQAIEQLAKKIASHLTMQSRVIERGS